MIDPLEFPRLTSANYRVTSPPTSDYNCIAWSLGDSERWWQAGQFWPFPVEGSDIGTLVRVFQHLEFEVCSDCDVENGYGKVALYAQGSVYTHAARQLHSGKWTSKLGRLEDIEHDTPYDVAGGVYGEVTCFLRRWIGTERDRAAR